MAEHKGSFLEKIQDKLQKFFKNITTSKEEEIHIIYFLVIIVGAVAAVLIASQFMGTSPPGSNLNVTEKQAQCDNVALSLGTITSNVASGLTNYFNVPVSYTSSGTPGIYDFAFV